MNSIENDLLPHLIIFLLMWSSLEAAIFEPASPSFVAGLGLITKILRNQRIYSK